MTGGGGGGGSGVREGLRSILEKEGVVIEGG